MSSLETDVKVQLVLVVAYDGSEPAQRALQGAAEMLRDRPGRMEVVYVAHLPGTVSFSAEAIVAVREGMDTEEQELAARVDQTLAGTGLKWHFQRRNGEITPELLAAGQEQLDAEGPSTHVVLVVGGSARKVDRYLNSTPARVIRQDRFEVLVIP
jgi:nucleotide-binding universal stress UspA family protein